MILSLKFRLTLSHFFPVARSSQSLSNQTPHPTEALARRLFRSPASLNCWLVSLAWSEAELPPDCLSSPGCQPKLENMDSTPTGRCSAAPLGRRTVRVICQRLLQPTGRFRRRYHRVVKTSVGRNAVRSMATASPTRLVPSAKRCSTPGVRSRCRSSTSNRAGTDWLS